MSEASQLAKTSGQDRFGTHFVPANDTQKVYGCRPGETRPSARQRVLLGGFSISALRELRKMEATGHYKGSRETIIYYSSCLGRVQRIRGFLRTMDFYEGLKRAQELNPKITFVVLRQIGFERFLSMSPHVA